MQPTGRSPRPAHAYRRRVFTLHRITRAPRPGRVGRHPGVTLIELLVAVTVLGVVGAVATLALRPLPEPPANDPATAIRALRRSALASGRATAGVVILHDSSFNITAYPDGSVVADSAVGLLRLAGVLDHAR